MDARTAQPADWRHVRLMLDQLELRVSVRGQELANRVAPGSRRVWQAALQKNAPPFPSLEWLCRCGCGCGCAWLWLATATGPISPYRGVRRGPQRLGATRRECGTSLKNSKSAIKLLQVVLASAPTAKARVFASKHAQRRHPPQ
jgi:hypothetical protein